VYEDVIEPVGERATIWNISSDTSDYFPRPEPYVRESRLVLSAGESLVGEVTDDPKKPQEWRVIFVAALQGGKKDAHFGFVAKADVKITRRQRRTAEHAS